MAGEMPYLEFLGGLHRALAPRTYLEIGIRTGSSLALSRSRSLGIDPDFNVREQLSSPLTLARTTSDEYFARPEPLAPLGGLPPDLAFIDGMHLFEFALRDFINVERNARWSSVMVFDDVLPRQVDHAARDRHTRTWTGDVFKIVPVLRAYRPDLTLLLVDTAPTGLLLVLGLDPASTVLQDNYDAIVAEHVVPDPQVVPEAVLRRDGAIDPAALLRAPVWGALRRGRRPWEGREHVLREISEALAEPGTYRAKRRAYRGKAQRAVRDVVKRLPAPALSRSGR
jgi:hypothetical protein